jgi:hypothetical protein
MKTNVVMIRPLESYSVEQRTLDGYFNATALLKQWNAVNDVQKKLDSFLENKATQEFINEIVTQENLNPHNSGYYASRGKNGGTWMHPLLFIDFAMWLNPRFKYHVLKFVYDNLLMFRKESGDSYKKMCDSLYKYFDDKTKFGKFIAGEALKIKQACGVESWEVASEEQLQIRKNIEDTASMIADYVHYDDVVSEAIKKNL